MTLRSFTFASAALLCSSLQLFAQATATSTLQVTAFDPSRAVIRGADVTVEQPDTGLRRAEKTGDNGSIRFTLLPAGIFKVTVQSPGFSTAVFDKVEVAVATTAEVNANLAPGTQTEIVNVSAAAPLVDSAKTEVSVSITPTEVQNLPLNGRDFASLAVLAPGAKPVNSYDPTKNRIAIFGVNGSTGRNVNVTVNGIDDKDNTVGGPVMQLPLEAVEEFNISTQRFSAANGRSEGAAINLVTKSGTNSYHGSLFLFARDAALNANDYFSEQSGNPTPPYSRQQYGGSFGGPIVKDRLFAFFAIERQRETQEIPVTATAFNELTLAKGLGAQPASTLPAPYNDQRYTGRLDYRISPAHSMFFTYNSQSNSSLNDQASSTNDLTAGNFTTNQLILSNLTLNSVLSSSAINSFTAGFQYWNNVIDSNNKVPYVSFPDAQFGTNPNVPQQSYQKKWQFRDDFSLNMGAHSMKLGFDFVNLPKLGGFFTTPSTLNVTFQDDPSKILSDKVTYPNGFATPGAVTAMSASAGNSYFSSPDAKMLGLYFQDDWKVTRNLNLNLGLRWDEDYNLNGGNTQALNRTYLELKAIGNPYAASLPKNYGKSFSPRIGFAWDMFGQGKHIIRGGYGIYYGQTFQNIPLFAEQQTNATIFTQVLNLSSSGPGDAGASIVPGVGVKLSAYRFGVDPLPTIPAASTTLPAGSVGRLVSPDFRPPYNQEFNLGYSFQLSPNDVIEIEGIHSLAVHEAKRVILNYKLYQTGGRVYDAAFAAANQPLLAQIVMETSVGRSRYDALNISWRRRMTKHFSINTNYVRSRALAYAGNPGAFGNAASNPTNIFSASDFGPAPNDEPHRWVFSGIYQAPWGIQIAPILQWASGRPYNVTEGTDVYGFGSSNGSWRGVVLKSDPNNLTATKAYTAAQLRSGLADGSLVTLPFDYLRGGRFFQADLRVSKIFTIRERHRIELLCQMFNLTNHANFGTSYGGNIRTGTFKKPTGFLSTSGTIVPHAFLAEMGFQYRF